MLPTKSVIYIRGHGSVSLKVGMERKYKNALSLRGNLLQWNSWCPHKRRSGGYRGVKLCETCFVQNMKIWGSGVKLKKSWSLRAARNEIHSQNMGKKQNRELLRSELGWLQPWAELCRVLKRLLEREQPLVHLVCTLETNVLVHKGCRASVREGQSVCA